MWMQSLRTKTKQAIDLKLISLFVDASVSALPAVLFGNL
jgi:hypothetical protein